MAVKRATNTVTHAAQARAQISAQMASAGHTRLRRWHLGAWLVCTAISGPAAAALAAWLSP